MARGGLTEKEEKFCLKLFEHGEKFQAVLDAGYKQTPKAAAVTATRLLKKAKIQARLKELRSKQEKRTEVTADRILLELYRIATVDVGQAFTDEGMLKPLKDIPEDVRRAIAGIEVDEIFEGRGDERTQVGWTKKVKFWDKPRALELLGKHLALFIEQMKFPQIDDVEWVDDGKN